MCLPTHQNARVCLFDAKHPCRQFGLPQNEHYSVSVAAIYIVHVQIHLYNYMSDIIEPHSLLLKKTLVTHANRKADSQLRIRTVVDSPEALHCLSSSFIKIFCIPVSSQTA